MNFSHEFAFKNLQFIRSLSRYRASLIIYFFDECFLHSLLFCLDGLVRTSHRWLLFIALNGFEIEIDALVLRLSIFRVKIPVQYSLPKVGHGGYMKSSSYFFRFLQIYWFLENIKLRAVGLLSWLVRKTFILCIFTYDIIPIDECFLIQNKILAVNRIHDMEKWNRSWRSINECAMEILVVSTPVVKSILLIESSSSNSCTSSHQNAFYYQITKTRNCSVLLTFLRILILHKRKRKLTKRKSTIYTHFRIKKFMNRWCHEHLFCHLKMVQR